MQADAPVRIAPCTDYLIVGSKISHFRVDDEKETINLGAVVVLGFAPSFHDPTPISIAPPRARSVSSRMVLYANTLFRVSQMELHSDQDRLGN